MKHSQGPWKCSMLGGGKGRGGNDWSVRMDVPRSDEGKYAIAIVRRKPGTHGETAANAHLIAAAPEMFQLLKEAVEGDTGEGWDALAAVVIAKAQGETL